MNTSTPLRNNLQQSRFTNTYDLKRSNQNRNDIEFSSPAKKETESATKTRANFINANNVDNFDEQLPFSPIPCSRNIPLNLLPFLDSPNLKWSTTLLTTIAGDESQTQIDSNNESNDKMVKKFCEEIGSSTKPHALPPTATEATAESSYVLCSPVLSANLKKIHQKSERENGSSIVKKLFSVRDKTDRISSSATDEAAAENDLDDDFSSVQHCTFTSDLSTSALEQICQISEQRTNLHGMVNDVGRGSALDDDADNSFFYLDENLPTSKNEKILVEKKVQFSAGCGKKKKPFVYPYRNVVQKPGESVLAGDLMTSALSMEVQDRDGCVTSEEIINRVGCASAGLTAFSELCNGDDSTERLQLSKLRLFDYDDERTILVTRTLFGDAAKQCLKDERVVARRITKFGECCIGAGVSIAYVNCLVQYLYSLYFFATHLHLGNLDDVSYRRNAITRLIFCIEKLSLSVRSPPPSTRFTFDFVNNTFLRLEGDIQILSKIGISVHRFYVGHFNALRILPSPDSGNAKSDRCDSVENAVSSVTAYSSYSAAPLKRVIVENHRPDNVRSNVSLDSVKIFNGFQTARGKNVVIEAKTMDSTKRKYRDIFELDSVRYGEETLTEFEKTIPPPLPLVSLGGFRTASGGRPVDANEKLVDSVKDRYFGDILSDNDETTRSKKTRYNTNSAVLGEFNSFKTGTGKPIRIGAETLKTWQTNFLEVIAGGGGGGGGDGDDDDASKNSYPNIGECRTSAFTTTTMGDSKGQQANESAAWNEIADCPSFDLSREITESTSAFLYDVSSDETWSFAPPSPQDVISIAMADTCSSIARDSEKVTGVRRKACSPIFGASCRLAKKTKCAKRKTQRVSQSCTFNPLNLTYSRKSNDENNADVDDFEALKTHFNRKSTKTEQEISDIQSALVANAKCEYFAVHDSRDRILRSQRQVAAAAAAAAAAATQQQYYVDNKPAEFCKPCKGYFSKRISNARNDRFCLRQLARNQRPRCYSINEYSDFGLLPALVQITSQNARDFVFTSEFISDDRDRTPIFFGDAAPVILNANGEITLKEIARAFLASPGVDPKLISYEWIANHYRWIVWKLASTERSFPEIFARRYLTVDNVLYQLKFRYDKEIDNCSRSALKRILEGDDFAARPLVLCVATITSVSATAVEYALELTDGWYSIFSNVDKRMNELIARKKVVVGTKLILTGAELIGWNEGCDPLRTDRNIRLKFSTNSSRRVRWHTRMGFYYRGTGPTNDVSSLMSNGGFITRLSAIVARAYPLLFFEKTEDSRVAAHVHNEKAEIKKVTEYEKERVACIEAISSQVTKDVLKENNISYVVNDGDGDDDDATIFSNKNDYSYENGEKLRAVIRDRIESRLPEKFAKKRNVYRLLKLRLVDAKREMFSNSAILTIWNPSDDVIAFFKEEKFYHFYNINENGIRNGDLQLSSNRSSKYDGGCALSTTNVEWYKRRVTSVSELRATNKNTPFDQVDITGMVVEKRFEQDRRVVYFADLQGEFFAVSFQTDAKNFEYGDTICCERIVAGVNLHWKKGFLFWNIPILFASEYTSFVQTTRFGSLQQQIDQFRQHFRKNDLKIFISECRQKLRDIVHSSGAHSDSIMKNSHLSAVSVCDRMLKPENSCCTDDGAIASIKRDKFEKLQAYGEPPPLSPITLTSRIKIKTKLPVQKEKKKLVKTVK